MSPRALNVLLLVGSGVFTALGQVPTLGPWQPACASLGWALAAIAKGLELGGRPPSPPVGSSGLPSTPTLPPA